MPNSSKIAFIFHGEPKAHSTATPLEYLGNDIEKMKKILKPSWIIKKEGFLERSFFSEESLSTYRANELDVLFYFTGHGIDQEDDILDEYTLKLSDNEMQNITTKELVAFLSEKLQPKTLTIILDTCYSGQATIETNQNNNIQILTSSNYLQESYESWGFEGGIFTHFFCKSIENACGEDETGKITLDEIANYIREPIRKLGQDIVEKAINLGELSPLAIAYNKEVWEIKALLNSNYLTLEALKKSIFNYYSSRESNFNNFRKADSVEEIFSILLKEKQCLYCILKKLGKESDFLNEVEDTSCAELEEKSINYRKVSKLIVMVKSEKSDFKKSLIVGYVGYDNGSYLGLDDKPNVNLESEEQCMVEMSLYIAYELRDKKLARTVDLELVLPTELIGYNYQKMMIPLRESNPTSINHKFNILKRLSYRIENHHLIDLYDDILLWEENSKIYEDKKGEPLNDLLVNSLEDKEDIAFFNKHDKQVGMLSNQSLTSHIDEIVEWGVPLVFYPHMDYDMMKKILWQQHSVREIKEVLTRFMTNEIRGRNSTHFIYDNYYDVDFLPNKEY